VATVGLTWATFHDPEWPSAGFSLLVCLTHLAERLLATEKSRTGSTCSAQWP
jgi:hypothetical protein